MLIKLTIYSTIDETLRYYTTESEKYKVSANGLELSTRQIPRKIKTNTIIIINNYTKHIRHCYTKGKKNLKSNFTLRILEVEKGKKKKEISELVQFSTVCARLSNASIRNIYLMCRKLYYESTCIEAL